MDRAQELPFVVVVLGDEAITDALGGSSVFFVGGPMDDQIVGFLTRWSAVLVRYIESNLNECDS